MGLQGHFRTHHEVMYKCAIVLHSVPIKRGDRRTKTGPLYDPLARARLTRMGLNRSERIAELEKKKQQIANRIVRLRNIESTEQRKLDTRRKILAGAWILHRIDQDTDDRLRLMLRQGLDDFLEHPRDRALFDLPDRPKPASEGAPGTAV